MAVNDYEKRVKRVNNSTNMIEMNNHLSPHKFKHTKTTTYHMGTGNQGSGLGQVLKMWQRMI